MGVCGYELCAAQSQQHPTSSLSPATLCDVRAAPIAKHSGFQLAALVCVGEGRARGQTWSVSPCRYAIWLLRRWNVFCLAFLVCSGGSIPTSFLRIGLIHAEQTAGCTMPDKHFWCILRTSKVLNSLSANYVYVDSNNRSQNSVRSCSCFLVL